MYDMNDSSVMGEAKVEYWISGALEREEFEMVVSRQG